MNTNLKMWLYLQYAVATFIFSIGFWNCNSPKPCENGNITGKICVGTDTLYLKNDSITRAIEVIVRCNELILNTRVQNVNELRTYLKDICFERLDSCECSLFELWGNPSINGIDVGVAIANAPKIGGVGLNEGLMANIVFYPVEPTDVNEKDTLFMSENLAVTCISENSPPTRIAIVDSGVDPNPDATKNKLHKGNWHGYNLLDRCLQNNYPLGLEYHSSRGISSPMDSNGHGTAVNGVLVGTSIPNFAIPMPLSFVNVDVMQGHTKSGNLYDGLCGLYYALQQEPRIINISWGFRFLSDPAYEDMDAAIRKAFNDYFIDCESKYPGGVFVIAGAGNDSSLITFNNNFYPACLAKNHQNVLSVGSHSNSNGTDLSEFSNYSKLDSNYVNLYAPGESIISPFPKYLQSTLGISSPTGYARLSGTSFAAPFVSRVVALIRIVHPNMSTGDVKAKLLSLTTSYSSTLRSDFYFLKLDLAKVSNQVCN